MTHLVAAPPEDQPRQEIVWLELDWLEPNPFQYRTEFNEDELADLASSIREHGILQPILVRPLEGEESKGVYYQLLAGERRWRAARRAGLMVLPAIVRATTDYQAAKIALVENVNRSDPPHWATAQGFKRLMIMSALEGKPLTLQGLADEVTKSRSFVEKHLNILGLDERLQNLIQKHNDAMSSAFELQKIVGHPDVDLLISDIAEGRAKFRAVARRVDFILRHLKWTRESSEPDAATAAALRRQNAGEQESIRETKNALSEAERHLMSADAWIPGISQEKQKKEIAPVLRRISQKIDTLASSHHLDLAA